MEITEVIHDLDYIVHYTPNGEKMYKVYLAKLKRAHRVDGLPNTVYKVGITSSADAMQRLTYSGADEPNPITSTFTDIKIMASTGRVYTREQAEAIEKRIMKEITSSAGDTYFHNWYEPRQLSGITEMRVWNYDEIQSIFKIFEEYKNV